MRHLAIAVVLYFASAGSGLAEYIEAPNYPKGQVQVNDTVSFNHGGMDTLDNSLEFSYGFTDRLAGVVDLNSGGGARQNYNYYQGADITAQIDLLKETAQLPGTALRLTYSTTGGDAPDTASMMGVFEKKYKYFDNFLNIAWGKTIGRYATGGTEFGIAAQSMYGLNDYTENEEWAAGFEYFGDYGKTGLLQGLPGKGQQFGPIIGFQPSKSLETSLNYLVGLTHYAPRSTVTLEVNYTF